MQQVRTLLQDYAGAGGAGVVRAAIGDDVVLDEPFGLADRGQGRAVELGTGFDIGSLVKPFTAAAIFALEAEGALTRDDRLGRFFADAPDDKRELPLTQLLAHTSGLVDLPGPDGREVEYTVAYDYEPVERDEFVRRAFAGPLHFAPGERFRYSNAGYGVLAVVIELVSTQPYEDFVRERIFDPAGMGRTGYLAPGWTRDELAVGYRGGEAWGTPLDHPWLDDGPSWNVRGAGAMISTASDLHRFVLALERDAVLSAPARDAYLALDVRTSRRGTRFYGPAGSNGIFSGVIMWDLDERVAVTVVTSVAELAAEQIGPELARPLITGRRG